MPVDQLVKTRTELKIELEEWKAKERALRRESVQLSARFQDVRAEIYRRIVDLKAMNEQDPT